MHAPLEGPLGVVTIAVYRYTQKSPIYRQKSAIPSKKSPICRGVSAQSALKSTGTRKRALCLPKRGLHTNKSSRKCRHLSVQSPLPSTRTHKRGLYKGKRALYTLKRALSIAERVVCIRPLGAVSIAACRYTQTSIKLLRLSLAYTQT